MNTFDPNDPRPLRIMIFPTKPQTILVHVPEGQVLWLPTLKTPFNLDELCKTLDDHDVPYTTTEGDPGKFWRNATQLESEEKSERVQQHRELEATKMVKIQLSPEASTLEKQRAELVLTKQRTDDEIRQLKAMLGKAKSDAYTSGTYLNPQTFHAKQQRLADLQTVSLALQGRLGELRERLAEQNRASSKLTDADPNRRWIEKAKRFLTKEQYLAIWDEVNRELNEDGSRAQRTSVGVQP